MMIDRMSKTKARMLLGVIMLIACLLCFGIEFLICLLVCSLFGIQFSLWMPIVLYLIGNPILCYLLIQGGPDDEDETV